MLPAPVLREKGVQGQFIGGGSHRGVRSPDKAVHTPPLGGRAGVSAKGPWELQGREEQTLQKEPASKTTADEARRTQRFPLCQEHH